MTTKLLQNVVSVISVTKVFRRSETIPLNFDLESKDSIYQHNSSLTSVYKLTKFQFAMKLLPPYFCLMI